MSTADRTSNRAWAMYPYYQARYGERGKRFSDSDTCWLVTLTDLDPESIKQQMNWLARPLATRGMPSIMLEKTIQLLHKKLIRYVPENKPAYDKLLNVADLFELNGWDGHFLGANTPPEDMAQFIDDVQPDAVGLSLSILSNIEHLKRCIEILQSNFPDMNLLVGGQAFRWGGADIIKKYKNTDLITSMDDLEKMILNS